MHACDVRDGQCFSVGVIYVREPELPPSPPSHPGYNPAKQMCAGQHDGHKWVEAGCGDSGGPLLHQSASGEWVQTGLLSWGYGHDYDIYTRVSGYRDWVLGCMEDEKACK